MKYFVSFTIVVLSILFLTSNVRSATNATISLSSRVSVLQKGQVFSVTIHVDTGGHAVYGVDITHLRYNPVLLEVQDGDPATPGVQIQPGTLFPTTPMNKVDTERGTITFSQISSAENPFTGNGTLATITFRAKTPGVGHLTIDFSPGNTRDSNVAAGAQDVLGSVVNATYTVENDNHSAPSVSYPREGEFRITGLQEGDLIRGPDGIKVYIINQYGYKRHIFNPAVFTLYKHFRWNDIKSVDQATLDSFKTSDLYRAQGDFRVFSLFEINEAQGLAQKRWLNVSANQFSGLGFEWTQVFEINLQERDYYQEGSALGYDELSSKG